MYSIEFLSDDMDCETCGWSSATGYIIYKNGEEVVNKTPTAHCYDSESYDHENALLDILEHAGIKVEGYRSY